MPAGDPPTRNSVKSGPLVAQSWLNGRRIGVIVAIHALLLAPWIGKNLYAFGVPRIANGFGAVFYLGAEFRTLGDEPIFSGMDWPNHTVQGRGGHMSLEGEKRLQHAALDRIVAHPGEWLRLAVAKVGRTLIGGPRWHFYPAANLRDKGRIVGGSETQIVFIWWTVLGTAVTVVGLGGLVLRFRRGGVVFVFGLSLAVYLVGLHACTFALPRFAVPLWPALVLGVAAWIGHPPRRMVAAAHAIVITGIVSYLTLVYWRMPSCEVAADRTRFFDITASQSFDELTGGAWVIELNGEHPAFNTCIFVAATLESSTGRTRTNGRLVLSPDGSDFDEPTAIGFPMRSDGRSHTYMLCTELNPAWKTRPWVGIRLDVDLAEEMTASRVEIVIGH